MISYIFLFTTFLISLLAIYANKDDRYVQILSLTIAFYSIIYVLMINKDYDDKLLFVSVLAYIVYLFSETDIRWK